MEVTITPQNQIVFTHTSQGEDRFTVALQRTLRLPEDGKAHALPPSLGHFPIKRIDDYRSRVPVAWRQHGGVFFPMWQREAMWLSFNSSRRPFAVKVAAGKRNAVSGQDWSQELAPSQATGSGDPRQDYMVAPPQQWLDGFNTGQGTVEQFVSMPLGMGYTVEGQVTGKEDVGGIQILALPPKDGLLMPILRRSPITRSRLIGSSSPTGLYSSVSVNSLSASSLDSSSLRSVMEISEAGLLKGAEMGLAKGGTMTQKIYPDTHGIDTWFQGASGRIFIHIVNSELYEQITGEKPPRSPITAQHYTAQGYPWFKLWDDEMGDVSKSTTLGSVKTVGGMDAQHGFKGQQDDSPIHETNVVSTGTIQPGHTLVKDGAEW